MPDCAVYEKLDNFLLKPFALGDKIQRRSRRSASCPADTHEKDSDTCVYLQPNDDTKYTYSNAESRCETLLGSGATLMTMKTHSEKQKIGDIRQA